jgi:hypothetical protein
MNSRSALAAADLLLLLLLQPNRRAASRSARPNVTGAATSVATQSGETPMHRLTFGRLPKLELARNLGPMPPLVVTVETSRAKAVGDGGVAAAAVGDAAAVRKAVEMTAIARCQAARQTSRQPVAGPTPPLGMTILVNRGENDSTNRQTVRACIVMRLMGITVVPVRNRPVKVSMTPTALRAAADAVVGVVAADADAAKATVAAGRWQTAKAANRPVILPSPLCRSGRRRRTVAHGLRLLAASSEAGGRRRPP